jgi:S1-C subfamily serine protease/mono/diheme cytochrome c family protein
MHEPPHIPVMLLVCAIFLVGLSVRHAAPFPDARTDADKIVFLLQYIGADYGSAVNDGRVIDAFEYREMVDFSRSVLDRCASSRSVSSTSIDDARRLQEAIRNLRGWPEIREMAADLSSRISRELGLRAYPPGSPDLARGAALYATDCAPCHGPAGGGDGWATEMDPPATSFRDARTNLISPHQVFNASLFGIDGTAMPSYAVSRSEQELWDVAFHVLTLREGISMETPDPGMPVDLVTLSRLSNEELLVLLRSERPGVEAAAVDYYRLHPPPLGLRALAASSRDPVAPSGDSPPVTELGPDLETAVRLENTFARVAESADPALVGIATYARVNGGPQSRAGEPHWRQAAAEDQRYPGYRRIGGGTGFFVTEDGYILSCRHLLIDPETKDVAALVAVELHTQQFERARVVAVEPTINLAVLKIEASSPTRPVEIADADGVRIGHWVIAAGNPPGAERSFVTGTIAARPVRDCYQAERRATLFQTSFQVPAGSYGGPLLDIRGRTIGISTPRDGGVEPVESSFAPAFGLPIDLAMTLFDPLRVRESRQSPWLGFSVLGLSREIRRRLPSSPLTGIYIDDVFEPSPASAAGIRVGDVLTRIDDIRMLSAHAFQKTLYLKGIGREVELLIYRDGETSSHRVVIQQRPEAATTR